MIFDIGNQARKGAWIMARDAEHALEIAVVIGHVKNKAKARVHDVTDAFKNEPGIKELEAEPFYGRIGKRIKAMTFHEMINSIGKPPEKDTGKWFGLHGVTTITTTITTK